MRTRLAARGLERDAAPLGGELDGVGQQVPHHLLETVRVGRDVADVSNRRREHDALLLGHGPQCFDRAFNRAGDARRHEVEPQLAAHDARDVNHVFDEPRLRARVAHDNLQRAFEVGRRLGQRDLGPSEHRVERRPQLVRHRGEKFVLRSGSRPRPRAERRARSPAESRVPWPTVRGHRPGPAGPPPTPRARRWPRADAFLPPKTGARSTSRCARRR